MPRKNAVQHGTPQGYQKHLKTSVWGDPCDDCKAAHAKEMKGYRERNGRDREQENKRRTARQRALTRLSLEYPERTMALIDEELENLEKSR